VAAAAVARLFLQPAADLIAVDISGRRCIEACTSAEAMALPTQSYGEGLRICLITAFDLHTPVLDNPPDILRLPISSRRIPPGLAPQPGPTPPECSAVSIGRMIAGTSPHTQ